MQRSPAEAARLARVFGDVLPDTTNDARDPDAGGENSAPEHSGSTSNSRDEWLRSQIPPHHG
ncbi:hypothetical protein OG921_20605 [Aldersonia sp. NBC_00410]|nr:hypothetical protein [Aldersonia sp. NBC_00410]